MRTVVSSDMDMAMMTGRWMVCWFTWGLGGVSVAVTGTVRMRWSV